MNRFTVAYLIYPLGVLVSIPMVLLLYALDKYYIGLLAWGPAGIIYEIVFFGYCAVGVSLTMTIAIAIIILVVRLKGGGKC